MGTPSYIFLSFRVSFFSLFIFLWCKNIHARNTKWKGTCTSVIYLKFVAVVLANAYICAYARSRGRNSYKVIISLWWMSRDRFLNEFTLTATQVHIKARSSCITAVRLSKRNVFFFPSLHYILFLIFVPLCLLPLRFFSLFVFSSCILPRTIPRYSRVYPVSRTHGDVCTETTYKKHNITRDYKLRYTIM